MTTPMADYFSSYDQPLLGADPFLSSLDSAWDADLRPDEYGDQSGHVYSTSWDEHSFTDSEHSDDDENDNDEWNMVYTTSITVTAATTTAGEEKCPEIPSPSGMTRRDSTVTFSEHPPQEHSYEHCSREEHSQLYYSVHELQKFIDEVRLETSKKQPSQPQPSSQQPCSVTAVKPRAAPVVSRST